MNKGSVRQTVGPAIVSPEWSQLLDQAYSYGAYLATTGISLSGKTKLNLPGGTSVLLRGGSEIAQNFRSGYNAVLQGG